MSHTASRSEATSSRPLSGIRVLEFTHAIMGPSAGLILADLGAEVIHVEPPQGDHTRRLGGMGIGYFTFFNRNKNSLAVDIKHSEGREIIHKLLPTVDMIVENFGPGTMERLGYGYEAMRTLRPDLIYCSLKGFLSGPYEKRLAMDEVVQMMGGLAYMTGPPGQPLRAGASVIDISGGMFGVIGMISALYQRERTGEGAYIKSALFETTAFMMGQHMAYAALSDDPVPPMPARVSAWSVYRIFHTAEGTALFIGVISDPQWKRLCLALSREDWAEDPRLETNQDRLKESSWLLPELEAELKKLNFTEACELCERARVCYAPVTRPEDLFDDPQLNHPQRSLLETDLPNGEQTRLPRLPIELGTLDFNLYQQPPKIGHDSQLYLSELGYSQTDQEKLSAKGVIAFPSTKEE